MPPCLDVYVWVCASNPSAVLGKFIDHYVDTANPGDPRFHALKRVFVLEEPGAGDQEALAELRRDPNARRAFSIYLKARSHHSAIITITEDGGLVLGLSLDDSEDDPDVLRRASDLMRTLVQEFGAVAGVVGGELPPAQSRYQWRDDTGVELRTGEF